MMLGNTGAFIGATTRKPSYLGLNAFELTVTEPNYDFGPTPYKERYIGQTRGVVLASGHTSCVVDWGDGSAKETYTAATIVDMHHVYQDAGIYVVTISDDVETVMIRACPELTAILSLGALNTCHTIDWAGVEFGYRYLFGDDANLRYADLSTSGVTSAERFLRNDVGLESVILPGGLLSIGGGVMAGYGYSTKLSGDIVLPRSLTEVGGDAFRNMTSSVTSIDLPEGVTSFSGNYLFFISTYAVILHATVPPNAYSQNTFYAFYGKFYVPAASVEAYKTAQYWSGVANQIFAIEDRA